MNYIDEFFLRADIQQIRSFLLNGVEGDSDPRPYEVRVESARKRVTSLLHERYPDQKEYDDITGLVYNYVSTAEAVSMELGLQAGAILFAQVYQNLKRLWMGPPNGTT